MTNTFDETQIESILIEKLDDIFNSEMECIHQKECNSFEEMLPSDTFDRIKNDFFDELELVCSAYEIDSNTALEIKEKYFILLQNKYDDLCNKVNSTVFTKQNLKSQPEQHFQQESNKCSHSDIDDYQTNNILTGKLDDIFNRELQYINQKDCESFEEMLPSDTFDRIKNEFFDELELICSAYEIDSNTALEIKEKYFKLLQNKYDDLRNNVNLILKEKTKTQSQISENSQDNINEHQIESILKEKLDDIFNRELQCINKKECNSFEKMLPSNTFDRIKNEFFDELDHIYSAYNYNTDTRMKIKEKYFELLQNKYDELRNKLNSGANEKNNADSQDNINEYQVENILRDKLSIIFNREIQNLYVKDCDSLEKMLPSDTFDRIKNEFFDELDHICSAYDYNTDTRMKIKEKYFEILQNKYDELCNKATSILSKKNKTQIQPDIPVNQQSQNNIDESRIENAIKDKLENIFNAEIQNIHMNNYNSLEEMFPSDKFEKIKNKFFDELNQVCSSYNYDYNIILENKEKYYKLLQNKYDELHDEAINILTKKKQAENPQEETIRNRKSNKQQVNQIPTNSTNDIKTQNKNFNIFILPLIVSFCIILFLLNK